MTTEEITKGNILIAEFMGTTYWKAYNFVKDYHYWATHFNTKEECQMKIDEIFYENQRGDIVPKLCWGERFDMNWGDLMPVVVKISKYKYEDGDTAYLRTFGMLNAETGKPMVRINRCCVIEADTLIEATYGAVIDFLTYMKNEEARLTNLTERGE
jgi:hypothetical protein